MVRIDIRLFMKATKRSVNKLLPEGFEIVQGGGYVYFSGTGTERWCKSSVYTNRISDLTVERWLVEFEELKNDRENNW